MPSPPMQRRPVPSLAPSPMGLLTLSLSVLGLHLPGHGGTVSAPQGRDSWLCALGLVSEVMTILSVTAALGLS